MNPERIVAMEQELLFAGFIQASQIPGNFYRPDTEWTAFAVNLQCQTDSLKVTYGYASTAFTRFAEDEETLALRGCEEITLCEQAVIRCEDDTAALGLRVRALLEAHRGTSRENLLAALKEKRKVFIASIAARMKPLGFRKTRNNWKLQRSDGFQVEFVLQKSLYSDGYYFNLSFRPIGGEWRDTCYAIRILRDGAQCLPWQQLGEAAMTAFVENQLMPEVRRLALTPLDRLACDPTVWLQCFCDRARCDGCWVQKNHWEAAGVSNPFCKDKSP